VLKDAGLVSDRREGAGGSTASIPMGSGGSGRTWHLDPDWKFDPDPATATEVEVTFERTGDGTLVTVEHRGFGVHGAPGGEMRDSVDSSGGWPELLERYAARAA
jgi:uncharacterized protein YndB with AHSA1/START domain